MLAKAAERNELKAKLSEDRRLPLEKVTPQNSMDFSKQSFQIVEAADVSAQCSLASPFDKPPTLLEQVATSGSATESAPEEGMLPQVSRPTVKKRTLEVSTVGAPMEAMTDLDEMRAALKEDEASSDDFGEEDEEDIEKVKAFKQRFLISQRFIRTAYKLDEGGKGAERRRSSISGNMGRTASMGRTRSIESSVSCSPDMQSQYDRLQQ